MRKLSQLNESLLGGIQKKVMNGEMRNEDKWAAEEKRRTNEGRMNTAQEIYTALNDANLDIVHTPKGNRTDAWFRKFKNGEEVVSLWFKNDIKDTWSFFEDEPNDPIELISIISCLGIDGGDDTDGEYDILFQFLSNDGEGDWMGMWYSRIKDQWRWGINAYDDANGDYTDVKREELGDLIAKISGIISETLNPDTKYKIWK